MVITREGPKTLREKRIAFLEESAVKTSVLRSSEESPTNPLGGEGDPFLKLAMCNSRGGQLFSQVSESEGHGNVGLRTPLFPLGH